MLVSHGLELNTEKLRTTKILQSQIKRTLKKEVSLRKYYQDTPVFFLFAKALSEGIIGV